MSLEITRVEWHGDQVSEKVADAARKAEQEAARLVLGRAQARVPHRTGALEASGHVQAGPQGAAVSYDTKYAPILHRHPEWNYQDGRSGTWLDEAVDETDKEVEAIYAQQIGSVIGG